VIVYRNQRCPADPRKLLALLQSAVERSGTTSPSHDLAVEVLLETGTLECAVADAVFPYADGVHPTAQRLREASLAAGHVLWHTWHAKPQESRAWWSRLSDILNEIERGPLPVTVETTIPEGFEYYAVYPETYLDAAKRCYAALGLETVVCLGLRSIGTSLSAVVAAALKEMGASVESFTLRPRGHPFSRHPSLQPELVSKLLNRRDARFLLVDEGPGISGSSLAGTAALLRSWGIADDRILFFPSWRTDGSQLQSAMARERWPRHRQFVTSFEEVWLETGRLQEAFPGELQDLSAGAWRQDVFDHDQQYPAVQPQHERKKFLLRDRSTGDQPKLLSFAGLGSRSRQKVRRAERLADAGFTPKLETAAYGFVLRPFVAGTPVVRGMADARLVEVTAAYLAHLAQEHRAEPTVSDSSLREMITVNVAEGLRDSQLDNLVSRLPAEVWAERAVALDGRMLAHEWIRTPAGYLKVDAMDHHDDHFFPGCQDIAWDLAAATIELGLGQEGGECLVDRYRLLSRDETIGDRIHPYAIAYLAFRLGYASLAATVLGETPDGSRFAADARWYADLLRSELHG
jgi:hypothetical protein